MCGIFGILYHTDNVVPDQNSLRETARLMQHRGPDNIEIFASEGIGLVHTRLSLLDLNPRSNQPFWDKQGRYSLVYNGEIYNFRELRAELEMEGVQFRTTSDTEVLLELLIARGGDSSLERLEGMFAFAVYDKVEKSLLLARDRFGIKPLYIYNGKDRFIFSSEIAAMNPWVEFEPDIFSISSYLFGFTGPTKGHSFFKNIKFLSPGTVLKIRSGCKNEYQRFFHINRFWDEKYANELKNVKHNQVVDRVEEILVESIESQLYADAPVGTLCSGGLDSSLITAIASKLHNNIGIFHANVVGPASEYAEANLLAKHLKIDIISTEVRPDDFMSYFSEVMEHFGHPFVSMPSSVPFLLVSKLVRKHGVKAVLTGEGSDECFLGYNFMIPLIFQWNEKTKNRLKRFLKRLIKRGNSDENLELNFDSFVMGYSPYSGLASQKMNNLAELVMSLHNRFEVAIETEQICQKLQDKNTYMKTLDLLNYNLRALLHRNDSLGMAASIEARFPFLDSSLVSLSVNMPHKLKIKKSVYPFNNRLKYSDKNKWILRKVAERYLPDKLSQIPKKPFNLGSPYEKIKISKNFFKDSFISNLFELSSRENDFFLDNASERLKIKLMHLEVWAKMCLYRQSKQQVTDLLKNCISL